VNLFKLLADLSRVDPDVYGRFDGRRQVFRYLGGAGKTLAGAALPTLVSGLFQRAYGQTTALPADVAAVLNLALSLEYLEQYFYDGAIGSTLFGSLSAADQAAFRTIRADEAAHVTVLRAALGTAAIADPGPTAFDFTAGGQIVPFANATNFLSLAQAFEDTGVRAYKGGAATLLNNKDLLTAAFNIHSVEARHASHIRTLRRGGVQAVGGAVSTVPNSSFSDRPKSWISGRDNGGPVPALTAIVYGPGTTTAVLAEDNTVQLTIDTITNTTNAGGLGQTSAAATEAFDEPLDARQVRNIGLRFVPASNPAKLFIQ